MKHGSTADLLDLFENPLGLPDSFSDPIFLNPIFLNHTAAPAGNNAVLPPPALRTNPSKPKAPKMVLAAWALWSPRRPGALSSIFCSTRQRWPHPFHFGRGSSRPQPS